MGLRQTPTFVPHEVIFETSSKPETTTRCSRKVERRLIKRK